jgi:hypothetical protein
LIFLLAIIAVTAELVLVALIVAIVTFSLLLLSIATITRFVANLSTLIALAPKASCIQSSFTFFIGVHLLHTKHLLVFQVQVMSDLLACHGITT